MGVDIKILKPGYSRMQSDGKTMVANGTSTLIKSSDKYHIVVDVLSPWDSEFMLKALQSEGIHQDDVRYVICSHAHTDHIGLLSMFCKADYHCVGFSLSHQDTYYETSLDQDESLSVCDGVEIIPTPGHTIDDVSVLVQSNILGKVAITGDLFERQEDIKNPALWRDIAGSVNHELQTKNRRKISKIADYVIPGHGSMFKLEENLIKLI